MFSKARQSCFKYAHYLGCSIICFYHCWRSFLHWQASCNAGDSTMDTKEYFHASACSQNDKLQQASAALQLYMQPHLASLPARTAVAMLKSCRCFMQLLEALPASCFKQLHRMIPGITTKQANSGADLLLMLQQQGRIRRSMQSSEQRCIQPLQSPPDLAGVRWSWRQLCNWPDITLTGIRISTTCITFRSVCVYGASMTQAFQSELVPFNEDGCIPTPCDGRCFTTSNQSLVITYLHCISQPYQLSCLQPSSGSGVNTMQTYSQSPTALSPQQNAYVALLQSHATAAVLLDVPSLQPRFTFADLPSHILRKHMFLRCTAWSPDSTKVAFIWSTRQCRDDIVDGKQRDEVLAIHAGDDGRLLTSFDLASFNSLADFFAPAQYHDDEEYQVELRWFQNQFRWSPDSTRISVVTLHGIISLGPDKTSQMLPPVRTGLLNSEELQTMRTMDCHWSPGGDHLMVERRDQAGSHGLIWNIAAQAAVFHWPRECPSETCCHHLALWTSPTECLILDCDVMVGVSSVVSKEKVTLSPLKLRFIPEDMGDRVTYHFQAGTATSSCLLVGCPTHRLVAPKIYLHFNKATVKSLSSEYDPPYFLWHANTTMPSCKVIKIFRQPCASFAWHPSPCLKGIYAVASYAGEVLLVDGTQHRTIQEWDWHDFLGKHDNNCRIRLQWAVDGAWLLVHAPKGVRIIHMLLPGS